MAKARKDNRGRALWKGESQRKSDLSYLYTYTDPFGKRRFIYAQDLKTLRDKEDKLKKDQLDGLDVYAAGNATLNFVFDRYISTKYELRKSTLSNYTYMYDHFVRDGFGMKKIGEIKYSDVKYFYYHLLNKRNLQANTVDTIHTILHPTFQLAVRDEIIRNNPTDGVMAEIKKKAGKNKGIRHALTIEQQRAFMNYTANNPIYCHWLPLFTVLLGTGARIGEIIGLRWKDLDYENRLIHINHSVSYYAREDRKSYFAVSLPKTEAGIRTVPMMGTVYEAFQEEHEAQKENGFNSTVIDGMTGFIFCNRFGNIHNPQTVNKAIKRILENHNTEEVVKAKKEKRQPVIIPHFSCHHLRHTFCTRFCEQETNTKVIQAVMGHANIETTMDIYAEVTDLKKKEAIEHLAHKLDVF
jgi:integrase